MLGDSGAVHPVGEVVDRASALARDAEPGTVLADATTSELGRGRYEFRTRDDGSAIVGEPVRGPRGERAGGAPFVGREAELAQVLSAFDRSRSDQAPILVSVTGPPGYRQEPPAARGDGAHRRAGRGARRWSCNAARPTLRVSRSAPRPTRCARSSACPRARPAQEADRAIVARLGPATRDDLTTRNRSLVARLLANEPLPEGLDPRGSRDALWLAMTDLVLQVALDRADRDRDGRPAVGGSGERRLDRPHAGSRRRSPAVRHGDGASRVLAEQQGALRRPRSRAASSCARSRSARRAASLTRCWARKRRSRIVDRIAEQAGGLPLFAEELARLHALGRDTRNAPTIQAAIQVSLDALDEECRDAVGRLSVLGLTCWDSALEALGMLEAEGIMKALVAAEILVEQNVSRFSGAREWTFKHALVRDVAYACLGDAERRELHALAAAWLTSMGEDAAVIAGHYDLGDMPTAAADHWERAAQRALATNALTDALNMAERSLAFAEDKVSGFLRASYLDEAFSRCDPRASERETAIQALEQNVYDEASAVRARGARARFDDARGSGRQDQRALGRGARPGRRRSA